LKNNTNSRFSSSLPESLKSVLLNYTETIKIRGEADFYGSSRILANALMRNNPARSFSSWSHGWEIGELEYTEQILWSYHWQLNRLVRNNKVAAFLNVHGFENVSAVGLPIIYTTNQVSDRKTGSVLFMPAHSLSYIDIDPKLIEMVNQAKLLKNNGQYVCFCVHADCVNHGKTVPMLEENSIDWFTGSSVSDINSLQRMRNIFDYFETVMSNTMGSHFLYAQLFGAKFSFVEPFFEYTFAQFEKDPFCRSKPDLTQHLVEQSSLKVIKSKYAEYFNGYEHAVCDQAFAEIECGLPEKVSSEKLASLLGWDLKDQILCPLPYFSSKLSTKITSFIRGKIA
jgi:hypothetical protein